VGVLHPDIVLRSDGGEARARYTAVLRGAQEVAGQAVRAARSLAPFARPVLVNGAAGVVTVAGGRVLSVMAFTVVDGKVVAIDVLADPERLAGLEPPLLDHDRRTTDPGSPGHIFR
jgi:RNA polymerase sigma-70 factor (ECF subfamily)